ncbi:hypothetical protein B0H14DRAFT_3436636 [Mycena olivaceomarginata]|nr:hypothetical protein B0H14DRAFT_3436636 [Mycena olivaceomarginata]
MAINGGGDEDAGRWGPTPLPVNFDRRRAGTPFSGLPLARHPRAARAEPAPGKPEPRAAAPTRRGRRDPERAHLLRAMAADLSGDASIGSGANTPSGLSPASLNTNGGPGLPHCTVHITVVPEVSPSRLVPDYVPFFRVHLLHTRACSVLAVCLSVRARRGGDAAAALHERAVERDVRTALALPRIPRRSVNHRMSRARWARREYAGASASSVVSRASGLREAARRVTRRVTVAAHTTQIARSLTTIIISYVTGACLSTARRKLPTPHRRAPGWTTRTTPMPEVEQRALCTPRADVKTRIRSETWCGAGMRARRTAGQGRAGGRRTSESGTGQALEGGAVARRVAD